jgi:hypothetical protein
MPPAGFRFQSPRSVHGYRDSSPFSMTARVEPRLDIEVIELEAGARAPDEADWISVEPMEGGRYNVAGCQGGEPVLIFANEIFASVDEAVLAGVFWARNRGIRTLYVERGS